MTKLEELKDAAVAACEACDAAEAAGDDCDAVDAACISAWDAYWDELEKTREGRKK